MSNIAEKRGLSTRTLLTSFIAILIGIVLVPIIFTQANTMAGVNGTTLTIAVLVPVFFVLAVIFAAIKNLI